MRPEIDQIAERLGVKDEARRKWRARGAVPHRWRLPIIEESAAAGVDLSAADMEFSPSAGRRAPEAA
jgi:hypothetical protein